jgi:CRISPR-associated protein Cas1
VPTGVFYPENGKTSIIKLAQYNACNDPARKLHVAKAIVRKATRERLRIIGKFCSDESCDPFKEDMLRFRDGIDDTSNTSELRGIEGNIMRSFFDAFGRMLKQLPFDGRSRQPPADESNALLGFGNAMLYNATRNEVYRSSLDPLAGFLHDPHENRASLAIDIAKMFRPIIVDNLILRLDRKRTLTPSHFDKDEIKCYLNSQGKKIWLQEFFDFMHSTIHYSPLERNISIKEEIRIECYNLIKYIAGEKDVYDPINFNNE